MEIDSRVEVKLKDLQGKFHTNKDVKMTMSRDPEGSMHSSPKKQMTMDPKKNRLSKRDSVFFKPTEKDNKVLGELILKVDFNNVESPRETAI